MNLCPHCGVAAPQAGQPCAACGAPPARPVALARGPDDPWCVAVRAQMQCRSCQRLSPLDRLDLDGNVRCRHCGVEQAWPPEAWVEPLALAAAVGDLGGPDPEGRVRDPGFSIAALNPHRGVGAERQSVAATLSGEVRSGGLEVRRALQIELAPGHPVCAGCGVALRVSASPGHSATSCPRCGEARRYRAPLGLDKLASGLMGALSPEDAEDRPRPETLGLTLSGPRGLSCPGCGAPLPLPGAGSVVTCPFCHLSSRLPDAVIASRPADPLWWWLVFRGPSEARLRLLRDPAAAEPLGPEEDHEVTDPPPAPTSAPQNALQAMVVLGYGVGALIFTGLALAAGLQISGRWPPW